MARKNVFDVKAEVNETESVSTQPKLGRPLLGIERPVRPASPLGSISQSLENINSRAHRADEIEKQLAEGQVIVELDPALIDISFVVDRLSLDNDDNASLVEQIREHGQQVPILVRPHPQTKGRFQVAYGHRRLAASKKLGRRVRAVVRDLTDEQLVVSQGQENNSRTDLSFIERAFFASRLEVRGFSREIIIAALGIDKAAASRMIALTKRVPAEIIEAIGPSPSFGRLRWAELADLLEDKAKQTKALKLVQDQEFLAQKSDSRFQTIYDLLKPKKVKPHSEVWRAANGVRPLKVIENDTKVSLIFDKAIEPEFGQFVKSRLQKLYEEYKEWDKEKLGD